MSAPVLDRPPRGSAAPADRPSGRSRGWSLVWRLARRDLRRHPGRTAAAAVMVLLPVMLASAAAVLLATTDVSPREADLARLASAEALVTTDGGGDRTWTRAQVEARVGVRLVEVRRGDVDVAGSAGTPVGAGTLATDLADPVTDGLVDVLAGRVPVAAEEVALTPGLAERLSVQVGEEVAVDGAGRRVTGLVVERWGDARAFLVAGGPEAVGGTAAPDGTTWLAPSAADIDRSVQGGTDGLLLLGRQDVGRQEGRLEVGTVGGELLVVLSTALALVVLEIALLAGPAFAVGVRQQQRTLALLAATGADGLALRRVVLAQALAVGAASAGLGAAVGTLGTALVLPLLRYRTGWSVGPLQVPWAVVVGFVLVGVVAALASALVPASTASKATVVGALASRTAARRLPWRRPLSGAVLLVAGTLLLRAVTTGFSEATSGASLSVLLLGVGMVLLVPLAVALLGRLTTRLPLGLRLAGRESSRAAGRSVAAVAAVAGASAGLVAALTLTAAATAADRARHVPVAEPGVSVAYADTSAEQVEALAGELLPGARTGLAGDSVRFAGVEVRPDGTDVSRYAEIHLPTPGCPGWADPGTRCGTDWAGAENPSGSFGSADVVAAELSGYDLDAGQVAVLEAGGLLLAEDSVATTSAGSVDVVSVTRENDGTVDAVGQGSVPVGRWAPGRDQPAVLLGERAARELGVWFPDRVLVQPAEQVASPLLAGHLDDPDVRQAALDAVAVLRQALEEDRSLRASLSTEVGYTGGFRVVDVVVVVLALVVLLGATFTATALALADGRPDRVVLTAVGAAPAVQRSVAGATAALVAGTGALLGGLVGLVPGVLVGRSLLRPSVVSFGLGVTDGTQEVPVPVLLLVPWGWLALLVVGLPLLAGVVVAAVAPGRPDREVTGAGRPS